MVTATQDDIRERILDELNVCLNRLDHSTTRYILESNPYLTDKDKPALAAIKEAVAVDDALFVEGAGLIEALEGVPRTGLPDPMLAELNYLSFPYLLDVLIADARREIELLGRETPELAAEPKAQAFIQKFLDARHTQLKKFQDLREKNYKES